MLAHVLAGHQGVLLECGFKARPPRKAAYVAHPRLAVLGDHQCADIADWAEAPHDEFDAVNGIVRASGCRRSLVQGESMLEVRNTIVQWRYPAVSHDPIGSGIAVGEAAVGVRAQGAARLLLLLLRKVLRSRTVDVGTRSPGRGRCGGA